MHKTYKKMLKGMRDKKSPGKGKDKWFLYILECINGTFYTGVAKNVEKRIKMHLDGKGARYTRMWHPVRLIYQEECQGRSAALVRECEIKSYSKERKRRLVDTFKSNKKEL